jgi:hypothetical protein
MIPRDAFAATFFPPILVRSTTTRLPAFSFFLPNNHIFIKLGSIIAISMRPQLSTLVHSWGESEWENTTEAQIVLEQIKAQETYYNCLKQLV